MEINPNTRQYHGLGHIFPFVNSRFQGSKHCDVQIICIRHAQAEHNYQYQYIGEAAFDIHDPVLTKAGRKQASLLASTFNPVPGRRILLCSPLRRTLQTAFKALVHLANTKNVYTKIIAWPKLRECGTCQASQGSKKEELERWAESEFGERSDVFNFGLLEDGWETIWKSELELSIERAKEVRQYLARLAMVMYSGGGFWNGIVFPGLGEHGRLEIIVVSHGSFLRELTYHPQYKHDHFTGAEWRSYEFFRASSEEPIQFEADIYGRWLDNETLVETAASMAKRGISLE